MKVVILILVLFILSKDVSARKPFYDSLHPMFHTYIGFNSTLLRTDNLYGLKAGIRWHAPFTPLYFGFEDIYGKGHVTYEWPNVGKFQYLRHYNCFSPCIGIDLFRKQKLNIGFNARVNQVNYNVQLDTDNETINSYLSNKQYKGSHLDYGFTAYLSYRINKYISCFSDLTYIQMTNKKSYLLYGLGISCIIIDLRTK